MRPNEAREPTWSELSGVLDQEMRRLPVKYRAAVLLCYVEGKTIAEAAEQLGLPPGTVKSRLARGRGLLHARLTRCGLALSAEVLVLLLAENASAAMPAALAEGAIKAALLVAAGQAAGGLGASAAALAEGILRAMWISKLRTTLAAPTLITLVVGAIGWLTYSSPAAGDVKADVVLPKDPKTVVISMTLTGGRIRNASPDPYLQVLTDGSVILTERTSGNKKTSALTPAELQNLLRFVIVENDFFNLDRKNMEAPPAPGGLRARVSDGVTTNVHVNANGKEQNVGFYATSFAMARMQKIKALEQYAAVEWKMYQLAYLTGLAPAAADARKVFALPKDPKGVVLSMSLSHNEIPTRTVPRPSGGVSTYVGSPRADHLLEIQANGMVVVTNRITGDKKETKLTSTQLQDVLRFVIQDNDFFKQVSVKVPEKDNPDARKVVIKVDADGKQHEVIVDGRPADLKGTTAKTFTWLDHLARGHVAPGDSGWQY